MRPAVVPTPPPQGADPNLPSIGVDRQEDKLYDVPRIPVSLIDPSPFQIRSRLDQERLRNLAESLRREGQLRPVRVRPRGERYELVYGHRTLEAARMLGWKSVEAIVSDATDEEVVLAQRAENREREDWSDYDRAQWYRMMIERFGYKQAQLADIDGVTQPVISHHLRMLRLEGVMSRDILAQLTEKQARTILSVPEELLPELCQRVEEYYQHNRCLPSTDDINIMAASLKMRNALRAIAEAERRKTEEKAPLPSTGESISREILSPTETPLPPREAEKEVLEEPAGAPVYETVHESREMARGVRPPEPAHPLEGSHLTTCPLCGQKMHRQTLETVLEELIRGKVTLEALLFELRGEG